MKKRIAISIIILVILIGLCIAMIIHLNNKNKIGKSDEVIIENSLSNYAWGFQYAGVVICKDGTIYQFSISDKSIDNLSLEERYKFILKNSKKINKKISNNDMYDIIKYSRDIDYSNYDKNDSGMRDAGASSIYVISEGKRNIIRSSGDWNISSNDENAKRILKIIDKYI